MRRLIDLCLGLVVLVTLAIVIANVTLRYVFNSGFAWSEEVARFLMLYLVFFGAVLAMRDQEHLRVTLLIDVLRPRLSKALQLVAATTAVGIGILIFLGSISLVRLTGTSYAPATGLPLAFIYGLGLPVGLGVVVYSIRDGIRAMRNSDARADRKNDPE